MSRVNLNDPLSSLQIFINEPMLRNIRKCTEAEAQRVTKKPNWTISLDDLEKFMGLIIARGAIGGSDLPIQSMWDSVWGCPLLKSTMPRNKFLETMRYLRFDLKSERRTNVEHDKFLSSSICIPFVENCQKAYIPNVFITVDEQLLPCKARCKFIQYMAIKSDKFGLKFWMAVDVESKYFSNGYPYLGKNEARSNDVSVPTDVVLKLMDPLFKKSYNVHLRQELYVIASFFETCSEQLQSCWYNSP